MLIKKKQGLSHYFLLTMFTLLTLSLQGCSTGFKPRGADSATHVPLKQLAVLIDSSEKKGLERKSTFTPVLERGLRNNGAELVTEPAPGVIVLKINGLKEDKTVSAYSAVRQVREFNHYVELDFLAKRQAAVGEPKQVTATVRAEKAQIYDSQYVLGGAEEERSIQRELRAEVVRLLALRLAVLK